MPQEDPKGRFSALYDAARSGDGGGTAAARAPAWLTGASTVAAPPAASTDVLSEWSKWTDSTPSGSKAIMQRIAADPVGSTQAFVRAYRALPADMQQSQADLYGKQGGTIRSLSRARQLMAYMGTADTGLAGLGEIGNLFGIAGGIRDAIDAKAGGAVAGTFQDVDETGAAVPRAFSEGGLTNAQALMEAAQAGHTFAAMGVDVPERGLLERLQKYGTIAGIAGAARGMGEMIGVAKIAGAAGRAVAGTAEAGPLRQLLAAPLKFAAGEGKFLGGATPAVGQMVGYGTTSRFFQGVQEFYAHTNERLATLVQQPNETPEQAATRVNSAWEAGKYATGKAFTFGGLAKDAFTGLAFYAVGRGVRGAAAKLGFSDVKATSAMLDAQARAAFRPSAGLLPKAMDAARGAGRWLGERGVSALSTGLEFSLGTAAVEGAEHVLTGTGKAPWEKDEFGNDPYARGLAQGIVGFAFGAIFHHPLSRLGPGNDPRPKDALGRLDWYRKNTGQDGRRAIDLLQNQAPTAEDAVKVLDPIFEAASDKDRSARIREFGADIAQRMKGSVEQQSKEALAQQRAAASAESLQGQREADSAAMLNEQRQREGAPTGPLNVDTEFGQTVPRSRQIPNFYGRQEGVQPGTTEGFTGEPPTPSARRLGEFGGVYVDPYANEGAATIDVGPQPGPARLEQKKDLPGRPRTYPGDVTPPGGRLPGRPSVEVPEYRGPAGPGRGPEFTEGVLRVQRAKDDVRAADAAEKQAEADVKATKAKEPPTAAEAAALSPRETAKRNAEAAAESLIIPGVKRPTLEDVRPETLKRAPKVFQMRPNADPETGDTGRVGDPYRADLAAPWLVWEAKDGTRYVVDAHNRFAGWERTDPAVRPKTVRAVILRESEGVTPEMARTEALTRNLAGDSLDPVDAASALRAARESGQMPESSNFKDYLKERGVAQKYLTHGKIAAAADLGELSPKVFDEVQRGALEVPQARQIARLKDRYDAQEATLEAVRRQQEIAGRELTPAEVLALARRQEAVEQGVVEVSPHEEAIARATGEIIDALQGGDTKARRAFATALGSKGLLEGAGAKIDEGKVASALSQVKDRLATLGTLGRRTSALSSMLQDAGAKLVAEPGRKPEIVGQAGERLLAYDPLKDAFTDGVNTIPGEAPSFGPKAGSETADLFGGEPPDVSENQLPGFATAPENAARTPNEAGAQTEAVKATLTAFAERQQYGKAMQYIEELPPGPLRAFAQGYFTTLEQKGAFGGKPKLPKG